MSQFPPITEVLKMLVVPCGMVISRQINMKDPEIIKLLRIIWVSLVVVIISIHFIIYSIVSSSKDDKKIWIPPKPKPKVIFVTNPPDEPLKAEDFEVTTYKEVETQLLKDSVQSTVMSIAACAISSYYFEFHLSLIVQSILMPITVFDNALLYRYIRNTFVGANPKARYYNEFHAAPTAAQVKKFFPPVVPREDIKTAPLVLQPSVINPEVISTSTASNDNVTAIKKPSDNLKKEDKSEDIAIQASDSTSKVSEVIDKD